MKFITAGESHGPCLTAIVSDVPAGLRISERQLNTDLERRQQGYGRGGRQRIETDRATVLSGIRFGKTLGTPITLQVANRDWKNGALIAACFFLSLRAVKRYSFNFTGTEG